MPKFRSAIMLLLVLLTGTSCQKGIPKSDIEPEKFYNITYIATHARVPESSTWSKVQGSFQMKFTQATEEEGGDGGTFRMHYSSYLEPELCPYNQNCVCSGGVQGDFFIPEQQEPGEKPYSPFDPYDMEGGEAPKEDVTTDIDPQTGKPRVAKIYVYYFSIRIKEKSLSSGCKPEADRVVKIIRFYNGDLIVHNDYRELYMVPVVLDNSK